MITDYENRTLKDIEDWKNARPDVLKRHFGGLPRSLDWMVERVIPYIPINQIFGVLNTAAKHLVSNEEASELEARRSRDLEASDRLAHQTHRWAMGVGAAEGAVTGVTGAVGLAADIPAIMTLAMRTIYLTGLCYGFDVRDDKAMAFGILAASGANSMEEKTAALTWLEEYQVELAQDAVEQHQKRSGRSLDNAAVSTRQVTRQLGLNLAKRKVLQTMPMIGAIVGGSVNAWFIRDVSLAAQRVFQEQWLRENHKLVNVAA